MQENIDNMREIKKSSSGLEANIAALLSYVLGFITGIVFFIIERDSEYVKFHAMQSILVSAVLVVLNFILGIIPILGGLAILILGPVSLILWIVLMVKAYNHTWFKLPVIGDMAEKQALGEKA